MRFEHLIQINDPLNNLLDTLTRDQLWQGLYLRVESPELFLPNLDCARIVARGDGWVERELTFGPAKVRDRVAFTPRQAVRYETRATEEHAGGTLTMTIEAPDEHALFLRFVYETTLPQQDETGDNRYAEIVKSAYHEADIDTVRKIRELAESGRLG